MKYRDFVSALIPTADKSFFIGVRNPDCKQIAKALFNENKYEKFLHDLPHKYYEEYSVHSYLINLIKDYDVAIVELNRYLPYVNNWSTCDILKPKAFDKNKDKLIKDNKMWLKSKKTYTIRFAVNVLMTYFLDDNFKEEQMVDVVKIKSKEYYVNMMRAWYFATALCKQRDTAMKYIKNKSLDAFTHNKSIQKAIESYRISAKDKELLRKLKVKNEK